MKTLLLLEGRTWADLVPVAENLRMMKEKGGYANQEQAGPRPEATATALQVDRISGLDHFDADCLDGERPVRFREISPVYRHHNA